MSCVHWEGCWKRSWAHAVIPTTELCPFPVQCCRRTWRLQSAFIGFFALRFLQELTVLMLYCTITDGLTQISAVLKSEILRKLFTYLSFRIKDVSQMLHLYQIISLVSHVMSCEMFTFVKLVDFSIHSFYVLFYGTCVVVHSEKWHFSLYFSSEKQCCSGHDSETYLCDLTLPLK